MPSGAIAIAECLSDSLLLLSTRRDDYGAVYHWDYYWKYPWCQPFFAPRVEAAERKFSDLAIIRADRRHARRREVADVPNYATLVRLADDFQGWLSTCRSNVPAVGALG